jgi:hypothetical protein
VRGTVTDAATGAPLVAATVAAGAATTVTGSDGGYSFTLPAGTYEMSATAYGYATKTATVTIADGGTATQNFALAALPRVTISGKVTDGSGHGWPLYARIDVAGRPGGPIFTDPGTGAYAFEVAVGTTYELTTGALYPGYRTVRQQVAVGDANVTHNVAVPVDAFACVAAGYSASFATPTFTESFDTTSTPPGWTVLNRTTSGGWTFNDPGARGT